EVWIDTAYEQDKHAAQQVGFASDAYFELLSAVPELGQYLALGQRVLVVYGDKAYEVVEGEGQAALTLPTTAVNSAPEPADGPAALDESTSRQGEYTGLTRWWLIILFVCLLLGLGFWVRQKRMVL